MTNSQEIRTDITQKIAKAMENACPPWRRPWDTSKNTGFPRNFVSGKRYRGVNPLLLMMAAASHKFLSKFWGTKSQWEGIGAVVQSPPGFDPNWGTTILFSGTTTGKNRLEDHGIVTSNPSSERFFFLKNYTVYNAEQVEAPTVDAILASHPARQRSLARKTLGEPVKTLTRKQAETVRSAIIRRLAEMKVDLDLPGDLRTARKFVASVPVRISHGSDKAVYWHPPLDYIEMPTPNSFDTPSDYFEVLYHELCHWGEADNRLGQSKGYRNHYAFSELVAEIGACFLAAETALPLSPQMLPRSMSYIQSWLSSMENNPRYIFEAARQSDRIVDYLLAFQNTPISTGA